MQKVAKPTWKSVRVNVHFWLRVYGGAFLALAWLGSSAAHAQTGSYALGTTGLLVGPASGTNSVELAVQLPFGAWTATANSAWLHLSLADQSGYGSPNVVFDYDANPGVTRAGTLTIAGQTVTVTQAGFTYVAVTNMSAPLTSGGNSFAYGLAMDSAGNVYSSDSLANVVQKWTATNNTVSTLISSGLNYPVGVAVDLCMANC